METKRQWMQSFDGRIRVGPEYQAMIPPFCKNYQSHQNDLNPKEPSQEPTKPTLNQSHSEPLQSYNERYQFTQSYPSVTQSYPPESFQPELHQHVMESQPFTELHQHVMESQQITESYDSYEPDETCDQDDSCDISSHIKFVSKEEELNQFESDKALEQSYSSSDKEF